MYSFVINIAKDVNRAVDLDITTPILRLLNDKVEIVFVEANPVEFSVIIIITFFFLKIYTFSNNNHYHF